MAEKDKKNNGIGRFIMGALVGTLAGSIASRFISVNVHKDEDVDDECDCNDDCECEECTCGKVDNSKKLGEKEVTKSESKTAKKSDK